MPRRDPEFEALLDEVPLEVEVEEEAIHKDDPEDPIEIVEDGGSGELMEKPHPHRHGRLQIRRAFRKARRRAERRADQHNIWPEYRQKWVARHTMDRTPCSCPGCSNHRDGFGRTSIQEQRVEEAESVDEMVGHRRTRSWI